MKQPYTVVLLYPDYMRANNARACTYKVEAKSPAQAVFFARYEAKQDNDDEVDEANDFEALAVFNGHLENLI